MTASAAAFERRPTQGETEARPPGCAADGTDDAGAARRETAKKKRKLVERDVVARVIEADSRER